MVLTLFPTLSFSTDQRHRAGSPFVPPSSLALPRRIIDALNRGSRTSQPSSSARTRRSNACRASLSSPKRRRRRRRPTRRTPTPRRPKRRARSPLPSSRLTWSRRRGRPSAGTRRRPCSRTSRSGSSPGSCTWSVALVTFPPSFACALTTRCADHSQIVGPVASGKTTLLMSLLSETILQDGSFAIGARKVRRKTALPRPPSLSRPVRMH